MTLKATHRLFQAVNVTSRRRTSKISGKGWVWTHTKKKQCRSGSGRAQLLCSQLGSGLDKNMSLNPLSTLKPGKSNPLYGTIDLHVSEGYAILALTHWPLIVNLKSPPPVQQLAEDTGCRTRLVMRVQFMTRRHSVTISNGMSDSSVYHLRPTLEGKSHLTHSFYLFIWIRHILLPRSGTISMRGKWKLFIA